MLKTLDHRHESGLSWPKLEFPTRVTVAGQFVPQQTCSDHRGHRPGGLLSGGILLSRGYEVHGVKRRSSSSIPSASTISIRTARGPTRFTLHYGDMTDATNLIRIIQEVQPDEIYNLAAQSHVQVSFETPEYTANADAVGALRLLEAIRMLGLDEETRFYQASTSEIYGKVQAVPQDETTPFYPRSPYAAAKLYAYWITVNYREAYGMHASNGILFNHESPIRGETFVTRKITRAVAANRARPAGRLYLGNLDAKRDWGHARDYVEGMWRIVQQEPATITCWRPAKPIRCANSSNWPSPKWRRNRLVRQRASRQSVVDRQDRSDLVRIDPRLFPPDGGRSVDRRSSKGARKAGLAATDRASRVSGGNGRLRPRRGPWRQAPSVGNRGVLKEFGAT